MRCYEAAEERMRRVSLALKIKGSVGTGMNQVWKPFSGEEAVGANPDRHVIGPQACGLHHPRCLALTNPF